MLLLLSFVVYLSLLKYLKLKHHTWLTLMILQGRKSILLWFPVFFLKERHINSDNRKNYMIGSVSQNRFHLICHRSNCWTMRGVDKYFKVFNLCQSLYPLTSFTMLSPTIYTRFVLNGFHTTFSLFLSFVLTSYWIGLELLKLLLFFWCSLLILLWFLLLSFAVLLGNSWSGLLLTSLLLQELVLIDSLLSQSMDPLLTSIALLSWAVESFDWSKFYVFESIRICISINFFTKKKIFFF